MKKLFLVAMLGATAALMSSCITGSGEKRAGYSSDACRQKCQRLGQVVSVAASADAGKCICVNETSRAS